MKIWIRVILASRYLLPKWLVSIDKTIQQVAIGSFFDFNYGKGAFINIERVIEKKRKLLQLKQLAKRLFYNCNKDNYCYLECLAGIITQDELAIRMNVSRSTISREIDILCKKLIATLTKLGYNNAWFEKQFTQFATINKLYAQFKTSNKKIKQNKASVSHLYTGAVSNNLSNNYAVSP